MLTVYVVSVLLHILLIALVEGHASSPLSREWEVWKEKYGKVYNNPDEDAARFSFWQRNLVAVHRHNGRPGTPYQLELNQFADQDFRKDWFRSEPARLDKSSTLKFRNVDAPESIDWRTKGAVLPVKNQGQLGSSSAFAISDSVSSLHFIQTGRLLRLSVQEVVDCCGNSTLLRGIAFNCIAGLGGLCAATDYPYHPTSRTCKNNSCQVAAKVKGGWMIPPGGEAALQSAVANGPVMAVIDASHASFQMYKSGIYYEPACNPPKLDHAVLVVGYGSENGHDYWIVKNSWGVNWGDKGYILMSRNRDNNCGIASGASYPY
ncbi:hypothetical protein FSP39_008009 [Pinctada imbricata]|uniref:Uncharacterized protein n=1 Tax=Pinctada imbricata TaxID=66713 RepID=A0AA88YC84_PINIB|nr:hypothetical protein FSP39_008009 [Pinctada imbricata]